MARGAYLGVGNVAHKTKKMYLGINGVARKVKKAYIGVNGIAKSFFSAFSGLFGLASPDGLIRNTYDGTNVTQEQVQNNQPYYYLVYCNGYFWACSQASGNYRPLWKSSDMTNWTQVSMTPMVLETNFTNDGVIISSGKYLCMIYSAYGNSYAIIYNTETGTQTTLGHTYCTCSSIGVTAEGNFILIWNYTQSTAYYYTIYNISTNTESSIVSCSSVLQFIKYATSNDRTLFINRSNDTIGYFMNNSFTFGSTVYNNGFHINYNGIVYGNGKFTTGYATSIDGLTWSNTLDGDTRGVFGFGEGLFVRYYRPQYDSSVMSLQISEDGINWTTVKADVPCSQYGYSYQKLKVASAAFKPI